MRKRGLSMAADPAPDREGHDPQFVAALARGLDVLGAFRRGDPPLGNQELAARTGLPKPTVSRITYTLSRLGYLAYDPETGRYTLGAAALGLGFAALGALGIRDVARPGMQALASHSTVSVALGRRDRHAMVYLEHCRGDSPLHVGIEVGAHIKLSTSAMGRAWFCGLAEAERAALMDQLAEREGARWPRVRDGLLQALDDHARFGFVLSLGDWKPEISAVGVPLGLGGGDLAFALNCGGPSFLLPRDRMIADLGPRLAGLATDIRRALAGAARPA